MAMKKGPQVGTNAKPAYKKNASRGAEKSSVTDIKGKKKGC